MTFDEGYGKSVAFLAALRERGQPFVAEIPVIFRGWIRPPRVTHRRRGPTGRPRKTPRLVAGSRPFLTVREHLEQTPELRDQPWQRFHVRDGEKGPMVWEAKYVWFYPNGTDDVPLAPLHLIVARSVLEPDKIKFFVADAPLETPLTVLLHVAFSRWRVERSFEDQKTELGFDHFEGRSYIGLMRHQTITALTHLFLSRMHQQCRRKNPELTVCQIRAAASALVQSWWLPRAATRQPIERAARTIRETQARKARSRRSHRKRTLRKLRNIGVSISHLPKCRWRRN